MVIDDSLTAPEDIKLAARRIAVGKLHNAGQICVAPDFVLATKKNHDAFVDAYVQVLNEEFFPNGADKSESYGRIVNQTQFEYVSKGRYWGQLIYSLYHPDASGRY